MKDRATTIRLDAVKAVGRYRTELGDVEALAKSIAKVGLLNPITITRDGHLIAGGRRLAACRLLGWEIVAANVADDLTTAALQLMAERDENTQRKAMTPEELVRLGRALEDLERPRSRERQGTRTDLGHQLPAHETGKLAVPRGETRDVVASALGISASTYERAKTVVAAASDRTLPADERAVAKQALSEMNATGVVAPAFEKVARARDARLGVRQRANVGDEKKQRHAIGTAVTTLTGITYGIGQITELHPAITSEEAAQWVDDLSKARRAIEVLIKRLKERTNAQA